MQPVPVGVAGELYVGGRSLARGYAGRPELTAERFLPDPFGPDAGGRLYRTGDRVRQAPDGQIEFIGRVDGQVKLRGYRIELGEIETVILQHRKVEQCAVVLVPRPAGDRLLAYVAWRSGAGEDVSGLRDHLRQMLPEYMVPSAFVSLEALPLTANGKVDRSALPAAEERTVEVFVAPRTAVEELLAGIFGEVLRVERVGANDSFFELGGHSLLATQVVSRIRESFGLEIPLRAVFESPSVAGLAERVTAAGSPGGPVARISELVRLLKSLSPEDRHVLRERERLAREGA
jgi:acyl carrier protein